MSITVIEYVEALKICIVLEEVFRDCLEFVSPNIQVSEVGQRAETLLGQMALVVLLEQECLQGHQITEQVRRKSLVDITVSDDLQGLEVGQALDCLLYTSPSPRDS